jgi:hypothetical protein
MEVSQSLWLCVILSVSRSFALMLERLLNYFVAPSFFYINNGKRRHIDMQPPDEDESVVVFAQPPRDELFSLLNGKPYDPLTPLENDATIPYR